MHGSVATEECGRSAPSVWEPFSERRLLLPELLVPEEDEATVEASANKV